MRKDTGLINLIGLNGIEIMCPKCNQWLYIDEDYTSYLVTCSNCNLEISVEVRAIIEYED